MKRVSFKRVICMILCVCMLVSVAAVTVMAENPATEPETSASSQSDRPEVVTAAPNAPVFPNAEETVWEFDFEDMRGTLKGTYESDICGSISMGVSKVALT